LSISALLKSVDLHWSCSIQCVPDRDGCRQLVEQFVCLRIWNDIFF